MEVTDKDADNYTPEMFDAYLSAWVLLPHGGELLKAQVLLDKREMQMETQLDKLTQILSWIHVNMRLSLQMDQERFIWPTSCSCASRMGFE